MSAITQIEDRIQTATDAVVQQIAASDDSIAGAVIGRNTSPHLVINGSFLSRDRQTVKTLQSPRRLAVQLSATGRRIRSNTVSIIDDFTVKGHYKLLPQQDTSSLISLSSAVSQELSSVGDLLFILLGTVKGLRPSSQQVENTTIKELRLVPTQSGADVQQVNTDSYAIRKIVPLEELLAQISHDIQGALSVEDRREIGKAYDEMVDAAITDVVVPTGRVAHPNETILGQIVASLHSQVAEYRTAVTTLERTPDDRRALNEVLRIAYNFSTDALPLISLFMSICDLKPLVFWCSVKEQWALYRAFRSLPWGALGRKEKLEEYKSIISQARSYAFHHILPFDSTFEADLSTLDVRADRIRLFVPFGATQDRGVHLKDQKLADVLAEFSRAKQRPVSIIFWQANLNIMHTAFQLAEQILDTLVLIHEARRSRSA